MPEEQIRLIVRNEIVKMLGDYSKIPLEIENALVARGFIKAGSLGTGVVYSTNGALSVIPGVSANVFVASVSGGAVTRNVTVTNGIITT